MGVKILSETEIGARDAHVRRHNGALLDHVRHHVAVGRARLHVRPQQVACAKMDEPKLLHKLRALHVQCGSDQRAATSTAMHRAFFL